MDARAAGEAKAPVITLDCQRCGAPIPVPTNDETRLPCPKCHAIREIRWFRGPQALEKYRIYVLFEVPQKAAAAAKQ